MKRQSGAVRIFLYNWPAFVATWTLAGVMLILWLRWAALAPLALAGAVGFASSVAALVISFYIYDRSKLTAAQWLPPEIRSAATWASIHAGLDAEIDVDPVMQGSCAARLDIFDAAFMTSRSIARARTRTSQTRPAVSCPPTSLALGDGACDAVVVAFTAHEIRDRGARERFFRELFRVLRPRGRVVLVEHLRDVMNLAAFGPGFLHFVPRAEWLRLAASADLAVAQELKITPWVSALILEKRA